MTKSNNDWVPEIGEKFEASLNESDDILEVTAVCYDEGGTVFRTWKGNYHNTNYCSMYRPIKTEAEKRLEAMLADAGYGGVDINNSGLESRYRTLIAKGWCKPNPLTESLITKLIYDSGLDIDCRRNKRLVEYTAAFIVGEG